jgi:hypothetical protein
VFLIQRTDVVAKLIGHRHGELGQLDAGLNIGESLVESPVDENLAELGVTKSPRVAYERQSSLGWMALELVEELIGDGPAALLVSGFDDGCGDGALESLLIRRCSVVGADGRGRRDLDTGRS